jgi:hypothetical protein
MPKHGCDDIRVVYLPARAEMGAEQRKEAVQDGRAVFGHTETCWKRRTSAIAVPIGRVRDVACGRVTAARYSRKI